jgi:hypothetical protein
MATDTSGPTDFAPTQEGQRAPAAAALRNRLREETARLFKTKDGKRIYHDSNGVAHLGTDPSVADVTEAP